MARRGTEIVVRGARGREAAGRGLAASSTGIFKPANVLLETSGRARVMDFGLAAVRGVEEPRTASIEPDMESSVEDELVRAAGSTRPAGRRVEVPSAP